MHGFEIDHLFFDPPLLLSYCSPYDMGFVSPPPHHHHYYHRRRRRRHRKAVFSVFKEVRRPQVSLVRDLVSAVLHPALLGMPELNADVVPADATGAAAAEGPKPAVGTAHHPPEVRRRMRICTPCIPLTDARVKRNGTVEYDARTAHPRLLGP